MQVDCTASSLSTGDVFILETPLLLYFWFGLGCGNGEREFAKKCYATIHGMAAIHTATVTKAAVCFVLNIKYIIRSKPSRSNTVSCHTNHREYTL